MRAVIQRVNYCKLFIESKLYNSIDKGLLILLAIEEGDNSEDLTWLASKCIKLRIFSDHDNNMNWSVQDIQGEIMIVSQFTLFASTKKGNRPGFTRSAIPSVAKTWVDKFVSKIRELYSAKIAEGIFGADMKLEFVNDGPVTIIIDTKNKE